MAADRQKFVMMANRRVNNAIKMLRLIGNLSNRSSYSYTEPDVEKIFSALETELNAGRDRFSKPGTKSETLFSLE